VVDGDERAGCNAFIYAAGGSPDVLVAFVALRPDLIPLLEESIARYEADIV